MSESKLRSVGERALDRFIETFNSRDARAWAASLSYPHIRVSPQAEAATFSPSEGDYAAAVRYERPDAMGWHHSAWDTKEILAVGPDKIHASAQWCRYNAQGDRILPNDVSYVITNVAGRWGIQARFGVDSRRPDDPAATAEAAEEAWSELWQAVAAGSWEDAGRLVRLPFAIVGVGVVQRVSTLDDVLTHLRGTATNPDPRDITVLQVGERGVNLGVQLGGADGDRHGLFLVVFDDGVPRVAAASLLAQG